MANVENITDKDLMLNIIDKTNRNGYVPKNQIPLYPVATSRREISDSIITNAT